ncbi:MAG TPA: hypothetical protein VH134_05090 [Candidatus Dormibacteraeota bacterium]|jgi:hypothetical protein|nr:hypothetical protein [Candidatus Dormibacteraeota bacterium]
MADRRVDLARRARIEQIALEATRSVLPDSAPRELHWSAMDAAEAAIAPRNGTRELTEQDMVETAHRVVTDICAQFGLPPRESGPG